MELAAAAAGDKAAAVRTERAARQAVVARVGHGGRRLLLVHAPEPDVRAVLRPADQQQLGVGAPLQERYAVRVAVEGAAQLHLVLARIDVPDDDRGVFGAGGQLQAVR